MRYFYDTEFIERGPDHPITLISIGIVAEDGREFYGINGELELEPVFRHDWLRDNVLPHLPVKIMHRPHVDAGGDTVYIRWPAWDEQHRDFHRVLARWRLAKEILEFLTVGGDPQLWAWYAAYDHVVLAQIFGTMDKMPERLPYWTNDLKQEVTRLGRRVPTQKKDGEHNALVDARWLAQAFADVMYPGGQEEPK